MSTKPAEASLAAAAADAQGPPRPVFDLERPWRLDERVAVRPEPFGALLYHFGTRRLSFLKNATMHEVVRSLAEHPSARSACSAAGVSDAALPAYQRALATLAESQMIRPQAGAQQAGAQQAGARQAGARQAGARQAGAQQAGARRIGS